MQQPAGLIGLFGGERSYLVSQTLAGMFKSNAGQITINGDVELTDGQLLAPIEVTVTGTTVRTSVVEPDYTIDRSPLGLPWALVH